jgi:dienelactone hydrolase
VRDGELTDTTYPPIRTSEASGRRLLVRAWYPAARSEGRRRSYFTAAEKASVGPVMSGAPPLPPPSWIDALGELVTHGVVDAPIAEGPFPTLIYSHGASSYIGQNLALVEDLASHGYVVLGLGHPGESAALEYPDGHVTTLEEDFTAALAGLASIPNTMGRATGDAATRLELTSLVLDDNGLGPYARRWVDDTRALLDALTSDAEGVLPAAVRSQCDLERIGALGMSFGAGAATSAAQADERIKAVVNLDGGQNLSDLLDADIRLPLLELTHDLYARWRSAGLDVQALHYNEFFYERVATAGTREDVVRVRLPGVAHLELTDFSFFPAEERAEVFADGGRLSSERIHAVVTTVVRGYFDHTLKGEANGYPDAQLQLLPELEPVDLAPLRSWAAQR